ncbi:MAG: DUF4838 domain-containing protein [Kiritimatiellae bacterium]|nr:DUF4838 domain-containing protein [Kiritimatiellia bacterium]
MMEKCAACCAAALMALGVPAADGEGMDLRFEDTTVVTGRDACCAFALEELGEIVKKAADKTFSVSSAAQPAGGARHRIFIGRSAGAERVLGAAFFDSLKDEESVVRREGEDIFLVGGGDLGALYAVYDFVEDNLGYRWYFECAGGDTVDKCGTVRFKGAETRRRPAFTGYRTNFSSHNYRGCAKFTVRNRDNMDVAKFMPKGWRHRYQGQTSVHSLPLYIPVDKPVKANAKSRTPDVPAYFSTHPEWFSLTRGGKRVKDAQLCLSNAELRDTLYANMCKWIDLRGPGVYKLDSNDNHNTRYCWCTNCIALEKKYDSIGGPLWDTVLDFCRRLKRDGREGVYVASLVYKGWRQTERAPANVVFPDNFIADAAFLNYSVPVCDMKPQKMDDGRFYEPWPNLQKWCRIASHVGWWYYGGGFYAIGKMQLDLQAVRRAGVKSCGSCGTGGLYDYGDMTQWMFFRLLRDPDADLWPDISRMAALKFGPEAGPLFVETLRETDEMRRLMLRGKRRAAGYTGHDFIPVDTLLRWRDRVDRMAQLVKGNPEWAENLRLSRHFTDIVILQSLNRIRKERPDFKFDFKAEYARALKAADDFERTPFGANIINSRWRPNRAKEALSSLANYGNLKSDELPPELKRYPRERVERFLPPGPRPVRRYHTIGVSAVEEPSAVCGWAISDWYGWQGNTNAPAELNDPKRGFSLCYYDEIGRRWMMEKPWNNGTMKKWIPKRFFEKDKYKLFCIGRTTVTPNGPFVPGDFWGGPMAFRGFQRLYDPTYENKEWELWISIKAQGPEFFPGDTRPNRFFVEQYFAVDMGVPEGK